MIIQCTECQSRFKLADDKLKPEGVKVRCTKCQHIFTVTPPPSEPEPAVEEFSAADQDDFSGFDSGQGGDFDFGAEPSVAAGSPSEAAGGEVDFSFEPAPDPDDFSLDTETGGDFSFGTDESASADFSFDQEETGTGDGDFSLDADNPFAEKGGDPSWASPDVGGPVDDFDFGGEEDTSFDFDSDFPESLDEPPPPPLAAPAEQGAKTVQQTESPEKKRKSNAVPPPSAARPKGPMTGLTVFLLVLLLVLGGAAGYFVWSGKSLDMEQLIARLTGRKAPAVEAGQIKLTAVSGFFVTNSTEGQLFVIRGIAVNEFPEARSAIAVKGTLYSKSGKALIQQTAYCGNPLDDPVLQKWPFSKIEESMSNQFGDSLSNLNVGPGKTIPFAIVFKNLPAELAEFATEVSSSQPGSKQ
jgi:predicted Zn finger-like uncharacterized protein